MANKIVNDSNIALHSLAERFLNMIPLSQLLAEALGQCHSEASRQGGRLQLEVFVVGRSRLENPGASALAEVFAQLGSLREVAMPQNGINKDGISALASAFAKNTELRVS